jgi:hypothetical protein
VSKPLDAGAPEPQERDEKPPTLEEFAASLQRIMGPSHPVTIEYPEPPVDGVIETKFFFVNRPRKTDEQTPSGATD